MNRRGVCYDVGTVFSGPAYRLSTRPRFDPAAARRELGIIQTDLHCNAVRITGRDIGRLMAATEAALELGLEVWLSPSLYEKNPEQTLGYYLTAASAAEKLRTRFASAPGEPAAGAACQLSGKSCQLCTSRCHQATGPIVFCLGGELTLFMRGIVEGRTVSQRLTTLMSQVRAGGTGHTERLNAFLGRAAGEVRGVFGGPLTYASLMGESVDWTPFDFIGIDHYRDARIKDQYADMVRRYFGCGKPVVVTEVGMRGYRGAEDSGTLGFGVIDTASQLLHSLPLAGRLVRPRLNGDYVRDEELQARELTEVLGILRAVGVDGVFVNSFAEPLAPFSEDPRHDLDMSALSLVKSYDGRRGTTYPDMPWEPKAAFRAVAACYAGQPAGA
jgi:hypothetical protein